MKLYFLLFVGLLLCLSISGIRREKPVPLSQDTIDAINADMEEKFQLRDGFKEKGNSARYITTHHMFY